jgi:CRISPR-associated protein Csd1
VSYEPQSVDFFIHLGRGGRFVDIVEAPREAPGRSASGKPQGVPKAPSLRIPRRSDRTSGDSAEFLVDKAEYVFGIDPDPANPRKAKKAAGAREKRLRNRRRLFREKVEAASNAIPDCEGLLAVARFLASDPPQKAVQLLHDSSHL